jgi:predicted dehydrogenase
VVGAGYVADLYMRSLATYPHVAVIGVYDRNLARRDAFCRHWKVPAATSLEEIFDRSPDLVLNLTNPGSHFEISSRCIEAGFSVYSEKPLAVDMENALELSALARKRGVSLASAPCSVLGEAGQAVVAAVRRKVMGTPRLVYAELDDDFITQAPYKSWISESGAPWPYDDEFQVGCTLEHAGYYLTWLIAAFGSVERVVAASAELVPGKECSGLAAPDFSVGILFFRCGVVARLTCSIVGRHLHRLRIIGDAGQLETDECWNNSAKVLVRRRFALRRRLLYSPLAKRIKFAAPTHPKVGRRGAAAMNFALGGEFALHLNEVTLALQNSGRDRPLSIIRTQCEPMPLMPWAERLL